MALEASGQKYRRFLLGPDSGGRDRTGEQGCPGASSSHLLSGVSSLQGLQDLVAGGAACKTFQGWREGGGGLLVARSGTVGEPSGSASSVRGNDGIKDEEATL